jgi:hypothetical protein
VIDTEDPPIKEYGPTIETTPEFDNEDVRNMALSGSTSTDGLPRMRNVLENSRFLSVNLDPNGNITFCNNFSWVSASLQSARYIVFGRVEATSSYVSSGYRLYHNRLLNQEIE